MKCFGCGVEKDPAALETYPFPEDGLICDEPISSMMVLDCQGRELPGSRPLPGGGFARPSEFRTVIVCHRCFHRLAPDMWISETCWKSLSPVIPYEKLPLLGDKADALPSRDRFDPVLYAKVHGGA